MPSFNACHQVASLAEASGIPYIEKLAKVAVAVMELLEQRKKNKKDVKALCESIANTVVVINTVVRMNEEAGAAYFKDICAEMEAYLTSLAQELKGEIERKHSGIKSFFNTQELRDTIQDYRMRVDDLKTDFLIHVTGNCLSVLVELQTTQQELICLMVEIRNKENTARTIYDIAVDSTLFVSLPSQTYHFRVL
ncbi:uncharacterized protein EV420DRAFT_1588671 [Desarmillaria tabescens]|uniref:Uncharacterized protein n=1 Tax=Armillaria tabescens TaxID=1929756 RepID=A0AA39J9I8_ARMTA|nr:uncharacterized protein EV420DRAFT_1588671 [Desarmillaria tabescens]KAK0437289.1 hypothetical protein EV420DRAFT_1588671 [Desarmillaria tabescens]